MDPLFVFVQFEFTHGLGPTPGRYVAAPLRGLRTADGDDGRPQPARERHRTTGTLLTTGEADVLVIAVVGARTTGFKLRRRARPAVAEAAGEPVPVALASFVEGSAPLTGKQAARERLDEIVGDEGLQQRWVEEGLEVLNRAIRAHRAGAGDPYVSEVTRRDARAVRIGYGTTSQVADGGWTEAVELPAPSGGRQRRAAALAPSQAVADALTGRQAVLEAEDLLLRTHLDLDHGRSRGAALQAAAALRLLRAELAPRDDEALSAAVATTAALADVALERPLGDDELEQLEGALVSGVRLLEARRHEQARR
ncbi:hypothetical protein PAI11_21560 [Patulibacter medicamentivorans]|uniref:Uncharacterized protein n=1 Tax=Patulibacter medicamentivorans TaxID=1097667 RepID=H0E5Q7_9ACTN|nr:hypothetical protein [Patulibacter medicamentivorans]EHN11020.1 hypothetical protein PAI11_21560 [Patulibacter medicamentivorans]